MFIKSFQYDLINFYNTTRLANTNTFNIMEDYFNLYMYFKTTKKKSSIIKMKNVFK